MKTIKYILGVALATMLIACSSDYENYVPAVEGPEEPTETIYFTEDELLVLMQMRNPDNRICIDEATEIALDALDFFDGEINTRSGQARSIADVTALWGEPATRLTTRSADGSDVKVQMPDTVAFVFNFADDAGFTIVAADTRIPSPILAFVDDGNLDLSEELDHPGLEVFFANMQEYIEYSIVVAEQMRDSLMDGILAKLTPDSPTTRWNPGTITVTTIRTPGPWGAWTGVRPLVPVEWGQWFPFNYLVRNRSCDRNNWYNPVHWFSGPCSNPREIPAGCVATATAMLMAFWGHPTTLNGFHFDWELLRSFTARPNYIGVVGAQSTPLPTDPFIAGSRPTRFRDNVARLMERIGCHINMRYGCANHGGSGAYPRNAVAFLRGHGYTGGDRQSFNTQAVINSINNGSPVLANGFKSRTLGISHNGHTWVIDGHLRRSRQVTITTITTWHGEPPVTADPLPPRSTRLGGSYTTITTHTITETAQYLHNNWGWNGQFNGYFVVGVFYLGDMRHDSNTRSKAPEEWNFRYKNEIYPNIRLR